MKLKTLICLSFVICHLSLGEAMAQQVNVKEVRRYVKRGNRMMQTGQRDKAYEQYRKAYVADSTNTLVNYNLATSMFPDEWKIMKPDAQRDSVMASHFLRSADAHAEDNPLRRSMAYHNIGVMHQIRANQSGDDQQKYQELMQAIEAYKQALRNNPHDDEARYNLVLCQRQLPENDNNQQNQNNDQQQQQEQQQQQQQQNQNQQQDQQQEPPQQQEQQNQEWIEQMLNAAEQREKQTRRRLDEQQNRSNQRRTNEKNW